MAIITAFFPIHLEKSSQCYAVANILLNELRRRM